MLKKLNFSTLLLILMLFAAHTTFCQPFSTRVKTFFGSPEPKISKFKLTKQITITNQSSDQTTKEFSGRLYNLLKSQGCENLIVSSAKGKREIVIEKVKSIDNTNTSVVDYYSIKTYKKRVEIKFTSTKASIWAYNDIEQAIVKNQNALQRIVKTSSFYLQPINKTSSKGTSHEEVVIDVTTSNKSIEQLKAIIENYAHNHHFNILLKLFSTNGIKIASPLLEPLNPTITLYKNGYTYADLEQLKTFANTKGVVIIPFLDFATEENSFFEKYTGHRINSTEGVRFTAPLLREFISNSSFKTISLGQIQNKNIGKDRLEAKENKFYDKLVKICIDSNIQIQ